MYILVMLLVVFNWLFGHIKWNSFVNTSLKWDVQRSNHFTLSKLRNSQSCHFFWFFLPLFFSLDIGMCANGSLHWLVLLLLSHMQTVFVVHRFRILKRSIKSLKILKRIHWSMIHNGSWSDNQLQFEDYDGDCFET